MPEKLVGRCLPVLTVLTLVAAAPASGQRVANPFESLDLHRDSLDASGQQPFVLRPFIRPGSETVFAGPVALDTVAYRIDYRFGRLWIDGLDTSVVIVAEYRTWGLGLREGYRREFTRAGLRDTLAEAADHHAGTLALDDVNLQRSGSITRGILAGNRRDATIESGLRLQLAGQVASDVRIRAVLTDESTPILPEGTTQRLSELDRVFIEIDSRQGRAQLGDIEVEYEASEFARFTRKVQGIGIQAKAGPGTLQVTGATARGLFWSQEISVLDGVQGPYRLVGQQSERFIFIVPGSEVVYIDGERAERGETNDYVIDYATGEITFTSTRLMRDDNRVRVEYQYRTTEFTRTVLGANVGASFGPRTTGPPRLRLGATLLREADGRTFDQEFGLTAHDRELLSAAGDSAVFRDGASVVAFDAEAPYVQYVRRDTLLGGVHRTYFASATEKPTGDVYRVRFSYAGAQQGAYTREGQATNGILYVWHGPGQGDYAPVQALPKPREQRMLDLRGGFVPVPGIEVFGEWARSVQDGNRFSDIHEEDDRGGAYLGGFRVTARRLGPQWLGTVALDARRRRLQEGFTPFNRIRPVEYARMWNLDSRRHAGRMQGEEQIDEAHLEWVFTPHTQIGADVGRIRLADGFTGRRVEVLLSVEEQRFPRLRYHRVDITSQDPHLLEDGAWVRQRGRLEQPVGNLVPALEIERERRHMRAEGSDSLTAASLAFTEIRPGIVWQQGNTELGARVEIREEDRWGSGRLENDVRAVTVESHFELRPVRALRTEGRLGWRTRSMAERSRQQSVVLRWSGRWWPWRSLLKMNWHYEALSERTPILQEIYIRTGPEIGEFVWQDDNRDGLVQIDEFVPETTQDEGTYVRTYLPSDTLQSVIGLQSRATFEFDPARRWREAMSAWKRRLANVSTRTTIQIQEKSRTPRISDVYLLRLHAFRSPEATLRGLLSIRQDVFLFRNRPRFGMDASVRSLRTLSALAAGSESRAIDAWRAEGKVAPSPSWQLRLAVEDEYKRTASETFASRSFDIRSRRAEPELVVSPGPPWRFTLGAVAMKKKATTAVARVWKVPLTASYARAGKVSITARLEGSSVNIRGARSTGLAYYELTDGRGEGHSYLWTLTAWYQLTSTLRATLSYNGRNPERTPAIHTVRMQLSAVF